MLIHVQDITNAKTKCMRICMQILFTQYPVIQNDWNIIKYVPVNQRFDSLFYDIEQSRNPTNPHNG